MTVARVNAPTRVRGRRAAGDHPDLEAPARSGFWLRAARLQWRYRTVLRDGVRPFLIILDIASWAVAIVICGSGTAGVAACAVGIVACQAGGLYRSRLTLAALADFWHLMGRSVASATAVGATVAVLHPSSTYGNGDRYLSRILLTGVLVGFIGLGFRTLGYGLVRWVRVHGLVGHNTLVLGAGRVGKDIVEQMQRYREFGLRPVGFLDSDPLLVPEERPVPVLGGADSLAQTIVEFGVRNVVVAFGLMPESSLVEVIRTCDRLDVEIFFVPRLFELYVADRDADLLRGLPLVRLPSPAFLRPSWRLKRIFDFTAAALALIAVSPLMAIIALGVRLEGGPGILFHQERVGLDGRPFRLAKFRSLTPVDEAEGETTWNVKHDVRLGPWGKFLRRSSLDELPQLWSVLRGDMSLVGPRPERPFFVDQFAQLYPRYSARHRVPAGMTGWSQVHGLRGDTSIQERARFDNFYIENWTLWLDLRICLMTVLAVLRRSGG